MHLKCICLNTWLGGKLLDEMIDFLRHEAADIVLLQEVFDGHDETWERRFRTMDQLTQALDYQFQDFDRCFTQQFDTFVVERGNAILSRLPILERHSYLLGGQDGTFEDVPENFGRFRHNLQHIVVDMAGTSLNLFNFQGVWDLDGDRDSPGRLQMSRGIMAAIADKPNVVLEGDTNAKPTTQTIKNIEAKLTNVFQNDLSTSFNLRHKDLEKFPGYATAVVDMAFVSPDLRVIAKQCPRVNVSDHLPLIFTVEVPVQ